MKKSTLWIVIVVVLVVLCCCLAGLAALGVGGFLLYRQTAEELNAPSQPVMQQIAEIETQVAEIRGLSPSADLPRGFLTPDELREKVEEDFFKDYTAQDAADDVIVLNFFGLLPRGFNLYQFYMDLYSEQIAGYYDPEVKEMFVVQDASFDGVERMTYAHEYTHVLQDQTFDMREGLGVNPDDCETRTEYCAAVTALIEGDATLTEQTWLLKNSTLRDKKEIAEFYNTFQTPILDTAPAYITEDMMFPYLKGLVFVQSLVDNSGWDAVDRAYQNPPQSTEQVLHPDRYPQDTPLAVTLPELASVLPGDWRLLDANTMGEWYTYLTLAYGHDENARVSEESAQNAAEGWGGDAYTVLWNEDAQAGISVLLTQWDSDKDAAEFWSVFSEYGQSRWETPDLAGADRLEWLETSDGSVLALREGALTLWIIAPNAELANLLVTLIPDL